MHKEMNQSTSICIRIYAAQVCLNISLCHGKECALTYNFNEDGRGKCVINNLKNKIEDTLFKQNICQKCTLFINVTESNKNKSRNISQKI